MFYGWRVVISVFTAQFFMIGFFSYSFPILVSPVQQEFGVSVTEVQVGISIGAIVGAFLAPVFGPLADRWSARGMMAIGSVLLVASLLLLSISQNVTQFVFVMATLISAANLLLGPITGSTLVSRWFDASRGRALGIAATGTSIGGMLIPLLLGGWIESLGWRAALQTFAACFALVITPLLLFAVRDHPSEKGLSPDGVDATPPEGQDSEPAEVQTWTTGEILSNPSYWMIGGGLGLLMLGYVGVLTNLHKYATTLGVEVESATILLSVIAGSGFAGKLIFGWAADRMSLRLGLWLAQGLAAAGIAVLSFEPGYSTMLLGTMLMGLAAGGMLPVWGAMIAAAFGVASYGRVMGLIMPIISVLTMPGPVLAGLSMDETGSYQLAFRGFVVAIFAAATLLLPLRLESPAPQAKPA